MKNTLYAYIIGIGTVIALLFWAGVILLQYDAYRQCIKRLSAQIDYYERAREGLSAFASADELAQKIRELEQGIAADQKRLPTSTVINSHKSLSALEALCKEHHAHLELEDIVSEPKGFYHEIRFTFSLSGARQDILSALKAIEQNRQIVSWQSVDFSPSPTDNATTAHIAYKQFAFIEGNGINHQPPRLSEDKPWLPPFPQKLQPLEQRLYEARQQEQNDPAFQKLANDWRIYSNLRKHKVAIEDIADKLIEYRKPLSEILNSRG